MIDWKPRSLAAGLAFPEGPVLLGPGDVAFVEVRGQWIGRARDGRYEVVAEVDGGPNGAALGGDGALYVANNGGLAVGPEGYWVAESPIDGCVQRVALDGTVTTFASDLPGAAPHRPNDLCFGPDGALYVTDPHNWEDFAKLGPGRLLRIDAQGRTDLVTEIPSFPNGIAFGADGRLYVAQSLTMTILVLDSNWTATPFCKLARGFPDGMCFTARGELIVCGSMGHVIEVFDPEGSAVEVIETGDCTEPTNCCLGDDVLYVTLSGTGELVAVDLDAQPFPLYPAGPLP